MGLPPPSSVGKGTKQIPRLQFRQYDFTCTIQSSFIAFLFLSIKELHIADKRKHYNINIQYKKKTLFFLPLQHQLLNYDTNLSLKSNTINYLPL